MTFKMTAGRYATALYDVAAAADELPDVDEDMKGIRRVLDALPETRRYCLNKRASASDGLKLVEIAFAPTLKSAKTVNALKAMAENSRLASLPFLPDAFSAVSAERENRLPVSVAFANPPEPAVLAKLKRELAERTGENVELSTEITPSLLGGFVITWRNRMIDNSVLGRVRQLQRRLGV